MLSVYSVPKIRKKNLHIIFIRKKEPNVPKIRKTFYTLYLLEKKNLVYPKSEKHSTHYIY
jgi:hypothetical protein